MLYIYDKNTDQFVFEVENGTIVNSDAVVYPDGEMSGFAPEVEFAIGETFETAVKNRRRHSQIIERLNELDVIVPRIMEDIIDQGGYVVHESKQMVIDEKRALREELAEL